MNPVSYFRTLNTGVAGLTVMLLLSVQVQTDAQHGSSPATRPSSTPSQRQTMQRYCVGCHNSQLKSGDLNLLEADLSIPGVQPELWAKVVRELRTGVMPPPNVPQVPGADRLAIRKSLERSLDAASAAKRHPCRTEALRRLNRTEYQNAIRDLLALNIDAGSLLPADESGYGFDNVNLSDLSPTLLNRYMSAAQKIGRLAVGSTQSALQSYTIFLPCRSHAGRSFARSTDGHARRHVHSPWMQHSQLLARLPFRYFADAVQA